MTLVCDCFVEPNFIGYRGALENPNAALPKPTK
jgi:hypothetical protein